LWTSTLASARDRRDQHDLIVVVQLEYDSLLTGGALDNAPGAGQRGRAVSQSAAQKGLRQKAETKGLRR
jgi:hypothetical protein